MESEQIHKSVLAFIEGRFPEVALAVDEDVFALGFVNSLFAMELVLFLEDTFSFRIPNEALRLDNFRTVEAMAALVRQYGTS
jgi:methoxymalonate biosynthesis acyl carrier protein